MCVCWPCRLSEQQRTEALRQVSGAQLVPGAVQTDPCQVADHAEEGQAVLGGACGRAGHTPQHLGAVLQVPDLCGQRADVLTQGPEAGRQEVGSFHLLFTLNNANHISLQRRGEHRTRQILQEADHPVTQGWHLQLVQVWKKDKDTSVSKCRTRTSLKSVQAAGQSLLCCVTGR